MEVQSETFVSRSIQSSGYDRYKPRYKVEVNFSSDGDVDGPLEITSGHISKEDPRGTDTKTYSVRVDNEDGLRFMYEALGELLGE